jgi:hypothetical protein
MNNRTLGTIAMICAPALLVEALLLRGGENAVITGIATMVFMAGWICSNTAMRRMPSYYFDGDENRQAEFDEAISLLHEGLLQP